MRGVAYALIASAALLFGASAASAGCYSNCDGYRDDGYRSDSYRDDGYRDGGSYRSAPSYERYERYDERPVYRSYSEPSYRSYSDDYDRPRYSRTYYGEPNYRTTYYERGDEYYTGGRCVSGCGYNGDRYYGGGYSNGYYGNGYYGNGYGYSRPYYRNYGYGYGSSYYGSGACYGGGCTQTGPSYAYNGYGGGYGYGSGYGYSGGYGYGGGCHTAYIPYGWTWYRSSSC